MTVRRDTPGGARALAARRGALPGVALLGAMMVAVAGATAATAAPARPAGPAGPAMVGVVAAATVGYVVTSASRRLPAPAPAPVAWGLLAVVATAGWETVPRATWWGLPTATTARAFADGLRSGMAAMTSSAAPWPAADVLLVLCLAGGLAGVGTASIWVARRRRGRASLLALSPAVALYTGAAALGRTRDPLGWTVALIASAVLFVATADGERAWHRRWGRAHPLHAFGVSLGLPALATVAVGVLLPGSAPSAASSPAATAPAPAPATVRIGARSLLADVPKVETQLAGDVMFVATTPQPSYWQVATLTRFRSTRWSANSAVLALAAGTASGPSAPASAGGVTGTGGGLTARIRLRSYTGALLPALPATTGVAGDHVVLRDGLVVDTGDGPGNGPAIHYETTAAGASLPGTGHLTGSGAAAGTGPPTGGATAPAGTVAADLTLPVVPARVAALARRLVAGVRGGPLPEAQALQQWFTSGRFDYSLAHPLPSGTPLSTFLFTTRTGSCVQFAGAFAVLARLDGLPTRLAVGFTPGSPIGNGRYVVDGADAHVWPQVYLGAQPGWVGFEPTPAAGRLPAGTAGSRPRRGTSPAHATPAPPPAAAGATGATGGGGAGDAAQTGAALDGLALAGGALAGVAITGVALAALVVAAVLLARRRRRRRATGTAATSALVAGPSAEGPDGLVLAEWRRTEEELGTVGLGRAAHEGLREHAARVRQATDGGATAPMADAYAELLTLVGRSCYSAAGCGPDDAVRARTLADVVTRTVGRARRATPAGRS